MTMTDGLTIADKPFSSRLFIGSSGYPNQQVMLDAREIKSQDEIVLLNQAAAMVDGTYQMINDEMKPGLRESDIVAMANKML